VTEEPACETRYRYPREDPGHCQVGGAGKGLPGDVDRRDHRRGRHHEKRVLLPFDDKNELARALVRRFRDQVEAVLEDTFGRAGELTDDPLQRFLIGLKLFAELVAEDHRDGSGCIIASICYQERLFDREVMSSIRDFSQSWRQRFHGYLSDIAKQYELAPGVDLDDLSDMLACIIDGAIIMARVNNDHRFIERQVLAYRAQVRMAFPTARVVVPQRPVAARPPLAA
jgi:TetR/AcrR family transcriptional repressor of nem operon